MPGRPLIEAQQVTRRFGDLLANDGVSLTVEGGQVVGLLGANGAGKSTFMRIVLGLLRPTGGTIRLLGSAPSRVVRRRVGYVPQGLGLYDDLTVAENLAFAARAYQVPVEDAIDAGLRAERDTLVGALPLGLRRRLAFTAALGHDPALLVLDEPTSGVDPLGRSRLWDTIRDRAERGAGVLVSTHYMEEAEHCDQLVVLAAGMVIVAGTITDIVGGRSALQVEASSWDAAFRALDAAGLAPSLHGRAVRLMGADENAVAELLTAARVTAQLRTVPANFEEAFVALAKESVPRHPVRP